MEELISVVWLVYQSGMFLILLFSYFLIHIFEIYILTTLADHRPINIHAHIRLLLLSLDDL